MKKYITILFTIALGAFVMTSCSTEESDAITPSLYKTATVEGKLLLNDDASITPQRWKAPQGVEIFARIDNTEYRSGASGYTYFKVTNYNAQTGEFSVNVKVPKDGAGVQIVVYPFEGTAKRSTADATPVAVQWGDRYVGVGNVIPESTVRVTPIEFNVTNPTHYTLMLKDGEKL